ncbi:MAG: MATE family efflux transporter [Anaerolineaceae bacterium]|nr:MATE family efflux transporter [Anaerolineaceae bacterium]MBQ6493650.1 MATE family efflux transporter [Erysipelotrichaceae bacterium]
MFRPATKRDILNGKILEQTLLFLFPVFMGNLLQILYGFIDSIILGRFVSKEALAAVGGSATSIINIVLNLIGGLTAAITVLTAQSYGKGDAEKVSSSVRTGMFTAICFGGSLSILMSLLAPSLLKVMGEPAENIPLSLTYMYLYFSSLMPYFVYQCGISILRALGDSSRPVYFILITAFIKISFDLLLGAVLKLGVLGTSLATFIAHLSCAIIILLIFDRTPDLYQFSLKDFGFDPNDLKKIFRIGIPFSVQSMLFALSNAVAQSKINEFGTDAIAAYTAFNNVDNLFWCFSSSVATSTITMASQNYGKGNIQRVRKIAYTSMALEACSALLYSVFFYFCGRDLLSLFLKDEAALDISARMLTVVSRSYVIYMFIEPLDAVFRSCGMTKVPVLILIFAICILRISYCIFYPIDGPVKVIFCYPLSWIVTAVLYLLYFLLNRRLRVRA